MEKRSNPHEGLTPDQITTLRQRAARLSSHRGEELVRDDDFEVYMYLNIVDERCGLPLEMVEEVLLVQQLVAIPGAQPHVLGLARVRGRIITFIDLRRFWEPTDAQHADSDLAVLVEVDGVEFGLLCASVDGVAEVEAERILNVPKHISERRAASARGIDEEGALLIDPFALLTQPGFRVTLSDTGGGHVLT